MRGQLVLDTVPRKSLFEDNIRWQRSRAGQALQARGKDVAGGHQPGSAPGAWGGSRGWVSPGSGMLAGLGAGGFPQDPGLARQGWRRGQGPGSHLVGPVWLLVASSSAPSPHPPHPRPSSIGSIVGGGARPRAFPTWTSGSVAPAEVGGRAAQAGAEAAGADGGEGAAPAAAAAARARLLHLLCPVSARHGEADCTGRCGTSYLSPRPPMKTRLGCSEVDGRASILAPSTARAWASILSQPPSMELRHCSQPDPPGTFQKELVNTRPEPSSGRAVRDWPASSHAHLPRLGSPTPAARQARKECVLLGKSFC